MLGLVNQVGWDEGSRTVRPVPFEVGRRLTTSAKNRVSPLTDVTPDCVVQGDPTLGAVAEAKLGLPQEIERWDKDVKQLEKYDDDLRGWWTKDENIANHDIIALVPSARSVRFCDVVAAGVREKKWSFHRKLTVVGFHKQTGAEKTFLTLKKECGDVSDPNLNERLRISVPIDIVHLLRDDRKFLDHKPPLPLILQILWSDLFVKYAAESEPDPDGRVTQIKISVAKVTKDLQTYYGYKSAGPRSPEIPKASWIAEALDALADFGLAQKSGNGDYLVGYRKVRRDIVEFFGRRCFRSERKKQRATATNKNQATLPLLFQAEPPQATS